MHLNGVDQSNSFTDEFGNLMPINKPITMIDDNNFVKYTVDNYERFIVVLNTKDSYTISRNQYDVLLQNKAWELDEFEMIFGFFVDEKEELIKSINNNYNFKLDEK